MKENSLYDKKSLRTVVGKTADFAELAKDCVAFSNAQGGVIDIGIENDDMLPPAEQRIPDELPTMVVNKISGITHGVIASTNIETAENGGEFIKLNILRNPNAIAVTSSGKIYVRIGDNSVPVGSEDVARLASDKGCISWEDTVTDFLWTNADEEKLKWFVEQIKTSDRVSGFVKQKDTKEMLDYFYMTDAESDRMTQLGVLFIGKQTQRGRIMNAPVVQCIKYDQYGEKVNKWLWDDFTKNPYEIIDEIWKTIPEWKESTEISDGLFRRNVPAYPESVIRELLANSLVHRPYTIRGDIFLNIYPDYIEIVNPGLLPIGVTVDNILHTTKKRNEHMATVFYVLHLMEREGSGYDMMYEQLLANGKSVPVVTEGDDWVRVHVERRVISKEVIKVMQYAAQSQELKQKQLICLGLIALHESVTASQLIGFLHLKDADALRPWLRPLVDKGFVVSTGERSKAKEYRVGSRTLRDSEYKGQTSLKRIESYRLRELIMEDLKIYQPCPISDIHVRIGKEIPLRKIQFQLKQLIAEDKVVSYGKKRWTKYCLKT
jgi:ATP-dependent DNA helicase RecG